MLVMLKCPLLTHSVFGCVLCINVIMTYFNYTRCNILSGRSYNELYNVHTRVLFGYCFSSVYLESNVIYFIRLNSCIGDTATYA